MSFIISPHFLFETVIVFKLNSNNYNKIIIYLTKFDKAERRMLRFYSSVLDNVNKVSQA